MAVSSRSIVFRVGICVALFVMAAGGHAATVHVSIDDTHVVVQGVSARGPVLLIGFQRWMRGYEPVFRRIERVIDADERGRLQFPLPDTQPIDSFWVAVDLSTGDFGSAVPKSPGTRGKDLPPQALVRGGKGRVEAVESDGDHAYVVVIRPGRAVFRGTVGDGAPSDDDGKADGRLRIAARHLQKLRGSDDPGAELENGDVVFVFPTHRMRFLTGVVKP
jgi:hypothetical protein